ncbi:hypothetical protein CFP56_011860, partial [Quercus suber]
SPYLEKQHQHQHQHQCLLASDQRSSSPLLELLRHRSEPAPTHLNTAWTTSYSLSLLACFLVSAAKASNPPKPQIEGPLLQQGDEKAAESKWSIARFVGAPYSWLLCLVSQLVTWFSGLEIRMLLRLLLITLVLRNLTSENTAWVSAQNDAAAALAAGRSSVGQSRGGIGAGVVSQVRASE